MEFAAAVQSGEVPEVVKNGRTMYTFEAIESGHVKEKDEKINVNRGVTKEKALSRSKFLFATAAEQKRDT